MSILSKKYGSRTAPITDRWLKAHGFTKICWGKPEKYFKDRGLPIPTERICWEALVTLTSEDGSTSDHILWWFPAEFDSYVTRFKDHQNLMLLSDDIDIHAYIQEEMDVNVFMAAFGLTWGDKKK
jgi:hypothetical protein